MADFLVSDFLDLLYEDLRKDFMSPLQVGKERWESYKAGRLSEIRQLLRIDLLENKYEEALDYTLLESHKEDGITIEKYQVERIKKLSLCVYVLRPDTGNGKALLYLNGHDPRGAKGVFGAEGRVKADGNSEKALSIHGLSGVGTGAVWLWGSEEKGCAGRDGCLRQLLHAGTAPFEFRYEPGGYPRV